MRELYVWAYRTEKSIFGHRLMPMVERHGETAMQCLLEAAERAAASGQDRRSQERLLSRTARQRFIDHLRRRYGTKKSPDNSDGPRKFAREDQLIDPGGEDEGKLFGSAPPPEDELIRAEELKRELVDPKAVIEALRQKHGEDDYRLFALTMEGYSSRQIANKLGVSAAAVRKRWERKKEAFGDTLSHVLGWEKYRVMYYLNQPNRPKRNRKTGDVVEETSLGDETS